jgi:PilZ domain-containing protein
LPERSRENERIPLHGRLKGEVMVFQPIVVLDVSHGGAQIETPLPLQVDSLHDFRLTLGDVSIVIKARIAYCRLADLRGDVVHYRSGVQFTEPSPHASRAIGSFVEAFRFERSRQAIIDGEIAEN